MGFLRTMLFLLQGIPIFCLVYGKMEQCLKTMLYPYPVLWLCFCHLLMKQNSTDLFCLNPYRLCLYRYTLNMMLSVTHSNVFVFFSYVISYLKYYIDFDILCIYSNDFNIFVYLYSVYVIFHLLSYFYIFLIFFILLCIRIVSNIIKLFYA